MLDADIPYIIDYTKDAPRVVAKDSGAGLMRRSARV